MLSLIAFAFPLNLRYRVRDGFTPTNSKAYQESKRLREFSGLTGDPMMISVILRASDKSSMIDQDNLMEEAKLLQFVKDNVSVPSEGATNERACKIKRASAQESASRASVVITAGRTMSWTTFLRKSFRNGKPNTFLKSSLTYPMATILGQKVQLERNFYGVKTSINVERNYTKKG